MNEYNISIINVFFNKLSNKIETKIDITLIDESQFTATLYRLYAVTSDIFGIKINDRSYIISNTYRKTDDEKYIFKFDANYRLFIGSIIQNES